MGQTIQSTHESPLTRSVHSSGASRRSAAALEFFFFFFHTELIVVSYLVAKLNVSRCEDHNVLELLITRDHFAFAIRLAAMVDEAREVAGASRVDVVVSV
eukprot:Selendium_serpulae@DN9058_c0_g1_i2.p1